MSDPSSAGLRLRKAVAEERPLNGEQRTDNKLIRPNAEYIDPPDRPWIPLEQRA